MTGVLFYPAALLALAGAAGLVGFARKPLHAALSLLAALLGIGVLCAGVGAWWVGILQILLAGVAGVGLLTFVVLRLGVLEEMHAPDRFPLAKVLGAGLALAALLRLGLLVAGLDLQSAAPTELALGFGGLRSLAFLLFTDRILVFELFSLLVLTGMLGAASLPR